MMEHFVEHPVICGILTVVGLMTFAAVYFATRKKLGHRGACACVVVSIVFSAIAYATASEKRQISFLSTDAEIAYLIDTGSYVSNNTVHVEFTSRLLPGDAMIFLDCIADTEPADSDNFTTIVSGPLSSFPNPLEFEYENAISNRWIFYTTYTPGPNVHTNGVAVAEFHIAPKYDNAAVPKRATIWENGERVWPSNELLNETADLLNALGEELE